MKKIILEKVLLLLIINILFVTSCNEKKEYKHIKGIEKYLKKEFNIELSNEKNRVFYFLPVNECVSCNGTNLELKMLQSLNPKKNILLIIVGMSHNSRFKNQIDNLNIPKIYDLNSTIYKYKSGVSKPLLLHIKNGKVNFYLKVNDLKINDAKKYLQNSI